MTYAATPATQPATPAAPVEEGKAPPTIDSHGGKLTPINHCYPDAATSALLMLALLSTLAPRRLNVGESGLDLSWTRLAPGALICALAAWNLFPQSFEIHHPGIEDYMRIKTLHVSGLLAFATLNLLADVLGSRETPGRSAAGMVASVLGLLLLFGLTLVDWYGRTLAFSPFFDLATASIWLAGVPVGVGLLFLWRQFDGRIFDVLLLAGAVGSLFLIGAIASEFETGFIGMHLVAFTVAASLGAALRGVGVTGWQNLSGRAAWVWAWLLRCTIIAMGAC